MNQKLPRQADDRRLLEAVARGEKDAFAALYDRIGGPLYTLCLRMIGDGAEAQDVLQEACLTIWRKSASYDASQSSVFSWAVHLTRGKAIDHLRRRGRRLRVLVADDAEGDPDGEAGSSAPQNVVADIPGAADIADQNERAGHLRRVLRALSAEECQVIEMAFFGGLTHHEISARLDQPLGTIKARIRRSLLKLRDELKGAR